MCVCVCVCVCTHPTIHPQTHAHTQKWTPLHLAAMSPKQNMLMVWLLLAGPDLPVKALAKTMGVLTVCVSMCHIVCVYLPVKALAKTRAVLTFPKCSL